MAFTNYTRAKLLNYLFGKQAFAQLTNLYFGLCTSCTDAGVVTGEHAIGDDGYARVEVVNNNTNFPDSTDGNKANGAIISFPACSGVAWGLLYTVIISDAASAGNILAWATLTVEKDVGIGDIVKFPIGDLDITLT